MCKKIFFFVTALISAQILIAQPYSEWREENRTGVSSETGLWGFELISSFRIEESSGLHLAHPVIHKGHLYIRHGNALIAYKIRAI